MKNEIMEELGITNKEKFAREILAIARIEKMDTIDAIMAYCERNMVDIEDAIPMLDRAMREQIRVDAIKGRYVRGEHLTELQL